METGKIEITLNRVCSILSFLKRGTTTLALDILKQLDFENKPAEFLILLYILFCEDRKIYRNKNIKEISKYFNISQILNPKSSLYSIHNFDCVAMINALKYIGKYTDDNAMKISWFIANKQYIVNRDKINYEKLQEMFEDWE